MENNTDYSNLCISGQMTFDKGVRNTVRKGWPTNSIAKTG